MILAAYRGDFLYDFLLFLHILTAIVGFGSTFVWPLLGARARALGPTDLKASFAIGDAAFSASKILSGPFIYAVGVTGVLLVIASDGLIEFSEAWISIAFLLYLIALGISIFVHQPNLRAMNAIQERLATGGGTPSSGGPPPEVLELQERGQRSAMFGGILHLLFLLILIDMIWKPGADIL